MNTSRETILKLTEIFETFRNVISDPTQEFLEFLYKHVSWLETLDNDWCLYDSRNKSQLTEIKEFLTNPLPRFEACITWWDEILQIALTFQELYKELGVDPMVTYDGFKHIELNRVFVPIVSELDYIFMRTPSCDYETTHEKNREFYYEMNAYILNPARVEKMANKYGLDLCGYLDAIDV
jgi:hypothetical protein